MDELKDELLPRKNRSMPLYAFYPIIIILAALIAFYFFISLTLVEGNSMEDTITDGQYAVLCRNGYSVDRGDIVTLTVDDIDGSKILIKRVVATAGDKVLFVSGQNRYAVDLYMCKAGEDKFTKQTEPYIKEQMTKAGYYGNIAVVQYAPQTLVESISLDGEYPAGSAEKELQNRIASAYVLVETDSIFFLGDNRNHSSDSRRYGTVKTESVLGEVISILEPNGGMEKFMRFMFSYYN